MTARSRTRLDIETAWRSFVVDGRLPDSLKPEIVRSWRRAREEWRVDPGLRSCPRAARADDVLARAEAEDAFRAASPVVTEFAERLAPDGHVVAYFDADGVMLALEGNARSRDRLANIGFVPGACWREDAAGTNGVGTALVEARPIEVFASEHFVSAWQSWTCASVPVRARGRVVGVIDITSPWSAHHPTLLVCAETMARAIEARLDATFAQRERAVLFSAAHEAVRARDEFLSVASHELKTPLTPLQLRIQALQKLVAAGTATPPEQLAEALRGADRHVRRLAGRIDDLLEMSRALNGQLALALQPIDLGATVRGVVDRYRTEIDRAGCEVVLTAASAVVGRWDRARIEQLFTNLLVNAVKYAPGRIDVEVGEDAAHVTARLLVRDRGTGIAPVDQERVFLPFERAVSYLNASGFGLGLYVVRQIVDAHGGAIRLDSVLGRGSTFVVELPLRRPAELPSA
jgi:signal transduction histidine kinase